MTPSQLTTLRTYVLATPALAAVGRNDTELARLLNLPSTFSVWRIDVPSTELSGAIKLSSFSGVNREDASLTGSGFMAGIIELSMIWLINVTRCGVSGNGAARSLAASGTVALGELPLKLQPLSSEDSSITRVAARKGENRENGIDRP